MCDREGASHYIKLTEWYIKKNNLKKAWKCSVKADKLYPSSKSKRLTKKLKKAMKRLKRQERKIKNTSCVNDGSSSSSSSNSSMEIPTKKSKQSCESSTAYSFKASEVMNKDESYRCLEKAEKYIQDKKFDSAKVFVLKSKKLFALPKADELLKKIQELQEISKPNYTEEQANIVTKVKNSENFYKMLNVETTATVPEIKKAYKKLALLLHPDKNPAPGSGEVFVVVGNAVETLCDHSKRITYDQTLKKPSTSTSKHFSQTTFSQQNSSYSSNPSSYFGSPYDSDEDDEFYQLYEDLTDTYEYFDSYYDYDYGFEDY